jgi:hypothetical protein
MAPVCGSRKSRDRATNNVLGERCRISCRRYGVEPSGVARPTHGATLLLTTAVLRRRLVVAEGTRSPRTLGPVPLAVATP